MYTNSFLARGADNLYENSLDPDQDRQNVGPDLDLNCLTLKVFPEKLILKMTTAKAWKISQHAKG